MQFSELNLEDSVLDALDAMNFRECTPVQEHTIPVILEGKDLIGVAQTGTGKTAAYLLPVLNQLSKGNYPEDAINCIIMAPTRELAMQIDQQMEGFSYFMPASSVAVYGGNDGIRFEQEKKGLTLGADVVIATPGRLISHLSLGYVDLSKVSFFILDEADRMLDMGFAEDIMQIVKYLPKERQTIMFSATMPTKIQQLAKTILTNPVEVKLAVSKPAEKIIQAAYICYEAQKLGIIESLFKEQQPERVIIFASSKIKVKEVTKALKRLKLNVGEMHSDLDQSQREAIMHEFRNGRINMLVATDIVARGIDIDDIRLVINYDVPHDSEDYVHRIGRTGRAGKTGISIAIINLREKGKMREIERIINKKFTISTLPSGKEICEQQLIKVIDDIEKVKVNEDEIEAFLPGIYRKLEWLSKEDLIKRVVSMEFNRFLEYYKNAPEIEQPKANEKSNEAKERKDRGSDREKVARKAEKGYTRLFLNLGKTDGFYANQIIELINRNLKKEHIQIGRIDLMQNFSFFEVVESQASMVMKALNKVTLNKGRKVIVEIAGENTGKSDKSGKKRGKESVREEKTTKKKETKSAEKKKDKPSREERGYTAARGPKKKDDWKQFFQNDNRPLRGEEPDFAEEGWAKRSKRKK